MIKILCLDSEPDFVAGLENRGYTVYGEEIGYRSGYTNVKTNPGRVDLIIFNLEKPACFDMLKWGTANTVHKCQIETVVDDSTFIRYDEVIPRYQLISYNQINSLRSNYVIDDIIRAVRKCPLLIFLNDSYMKHVYRPPNFFDIRIRYSRTETGKFLIDEQIAKVVPLLFRGDLSIKSLKYQIDAEYGVRYPKYRDVVFDEYGKVFSRIFLDGSSFIWLLPEFGKNEQAVFYIIENLGGLNSLFDSLRQGTS
jgi:hypothetical protein